ncbi:MAG: dTDP-glucose 4,6-dehydratase, partial [Bacteroidia bacterium]|nr:dTDP-glucose 4,6-dehydratase [Bacteroidia bacterium]
MQQNILITGGAGFIGSHLVRHFVNRYPGYHIFNLDNLTYAGNLANLADVADSPTYTFIKGDICDANHLREIFESCQISGVIHLAAESHVDRSILDPLAFVTTNVLGTVTLLNAARHAWKGREDVRFYHVSTDEVYGSLAPGEYFTETTPYDPQSPYSASKASSDHFVRAYGNTYHLPYVLSNCSNNYGPYHFPEKLIPLFISNILENKPLPVYGKGDNVRDWLWVLDHCEAIDVIFHRGQNGRTYNIGGRNEWKNLDLVKLLCTLMDQKLGRPDGTAASLITYVTDRPGHDHRYAIDPSRLENELGWRPSLTFEDGLSRTVDWYL